MKRQYLQKHKLPSKPGVYTFRDAKKRPTYIGRATFLADRVRSYFAPDLIVTRGPRIVDMVTKASSLTYQETSSVLEAILLESAEIKKYQPFYNVAERDDKSDQYVVITKEAWPRVFLVRARDYEQQVKNGTLGYEVDKCYGPFNESFVIKSALKILRRLFPFRDKKAHDPRHESFYQALGMSPDTQGTEAHKAYLRTIKYLSMYFEGRTKVLRTKLRGDMKRLARELKFEEAGEVRKLLFALDHINDISLIKAERMNNIENGARQFRMEAYDIAHLSGMETVGAMVVSVNGQFMPSEYRKFKISKDSNNDTANLAELLFRRLNHTEWRYPDLIIVDGNEVQQKYAEKVLQARRISIPVVAVTKDERHKAARVVGGESLSAADNTYVIALNAECHRFAISYHRKRRNMRLQRFV